MRFVFRFRSVTALLILACVAINLIWMPNSVSWSKILGGAAAWTLPIQFGQAHTAIYVLMLAMMVVFVLILLVMTNYSKVLALLCMLGVSLSLVLSWSFHFALPAMWLLPLWASWRLSGSPTMRVGSNTK